MLSGCGVLLGVVAGARAAVLGGPPGGYNETYGYPDGIGGLIIEGPFPYKNGPATWNQPGGKVDGFGAYGLIVAPGKVTNGKCTPLPADSPFVGSANQPVPLTDGANACLVGCNISDIERTGVDPCHAGNVGPPHSNSPMSCFDVGPGMAGGFGLCGYNCSAFQAHPSASGEPVPCDKANFGKCFIWCDSRTFPGK